MPVLLLTEDDVRQLLTMEMALEAVEEALRKMALEEAHNVPRARCQTDHAMLHMMSAAAKSLGVMGYKTYATSRKGQDFLIGLYDGRTAALLATQSATLDACAALAAHQPDARCEAGADAVAAEHLR